MVKRLILYKTKRLAAGLAALALLGACLLLAACGALSGEQSGAAETAGSGAEQEIAETPMPTAEPVRQSGALDTVLLDGVMLHVAAKSYRFVQDDCIGVTVAAKNDNGNPATVWLVLAGVNGWDVKKQQQSMQTIRLAPGEERSQEIVFDLTEPRARELGLGALTELAFTVEGYVDSADYEFAMEESVISLPDAPEGYAQAYAPDAAVLLDSDRLTLALCKQDETSGELTLYYAVKEAAEGTSCRLYPLENGVFDMQRYPVVDELDTSAVTRQMIAFLPADADAAAALDGFYAVTEGIKTPPARLTIPGKDGKNALRQTLDAMEPVAQNESLRIYYDAQSRRFFAENLTEEQTLLLENDAEFLLDGLPVRANPQSVPCFPQSATAFRISGRGKDADGMERNRVIDETSQTVSVGWRVRPFGEEAEAETEAAVLETGVLTLAD